MLRWSVLMLALPLASAFIPAGRVISRDLAMMARKKKEMPPNPVAIGELLEHHIYRSIYLCISCFAVTGGSRGIGRCSSLVTS